MREWIASFIYGTMYVASYFFYWTWAVIAQNPFFLIALVVLGAIIGYNLKD